MSKYDEKTLVLNYKEAKKRHDELKRMTSDAWRTVEIAAAKINEYMDEIGADSTARYDGIGRVTRGTPTLYAKFDENDKDKVFNFLKERGLGDVIKESVHHSTFSSLVSGMIKEGDSVPEFIQTSFRQNLRLNQ